MTASSTVGVRTTARPNPLRRRDFRLLWSGQAVSSLGDQFALVALPWLALVLTGSSLALGSVLAAMAIPRAVLMLVGGVYVDRLSPRRVMLGSNVVRLAAVVLLGVVTLAGEVSLPLLYGFAITFGVADAFFYPAHQSVVPTLVASDEIPAANAIVQGTTQLTVFVGPALAGIAIAALGTAGPKPSLAGIGAALLIDGASFGASIVTLALIREPARAAREPQPVLAAIRAGLAYVLGWPTLLAAVLLAMSVNLLLVGPMAVGLPTIAYTRLPEGAAAYGTMMSAMGLGALLGMISVAVLPQPRASALGPFVVCVMGVGGLAVASTALISSTPVMAAAVAVAGFATGYANLMLITWAQQRIPAELMGRVFSLILLGSIALIPLSQLVAGFTVAIDLDATMIAAGLAMAALTIIAALTPAVRGMGLAPPVVQVPAT